MVYTSFALMASSLILMLVLAPSAEDLGTSSGDAARISEASFFLESVLADMDRSLSIATRRALTGATNYVIENGEPLVDPGENLTSAMVNGTISGQELNATGDASLSVWTRRVGRIAQNSGYRVKIDIRDYSFNPSGLDVASSYSVRASLYDPATLVRLNRSRTSHVEVSASGLEDTMLLLRSVGRYTNQYTRCRFDDPADRLYTGTGTGTAHGLAAVNPADASSVSNSGEKVLVADDIDSYAVSDVNTFAGAVSAQPNSTTGYTVPRVFDTGSIAGVKQNMSLVLHSGEVWRTGFRSMFQDGCYVETVRGPDVMDRFENELVNEPGETGIATLLELPRLPPSLQRTGSAVGYVYFNGTGYGGLNEVSGVSGEYPWFRLDDYHVDLWGLEPLAH
ncbi:MAG: hypothetical protein ABEJ07_00905 [Candidatus Nanohaloarchaea archaeon]